jgi:hypothetical protein
LGLHAAQRYRSQLENLSDLESAEMFPKACVEEEQWPPTESLKLADVRAIRTPAARSLRQPDTHLRPKALEVRRCAPSPLRLK